VGSVGQEFFEVVAGGIVEGEARCLPEQRIEVLQLSLVACLCLEHLLLRRQEHAVETAKDCQREDNILVLAALEGVADEVGDAP